jgi:hypothetical protein
MRGSNLGSTWHDSKEITWSMPKISLLGVPSVGTPNSTIHPRGRRRTSSRRHLVASRCNNTSASCQMPCSKGRHKVYKNTRYRSIAMTVIYTWGRWPWLSPAPRWLAELTEERVRSVAGEAKSWLRIYLLTYTWIVWSCRSMRKWYWYYRRHEKNIGLPNLKREYIYNVYSCHHHQYI